MEHSGKTPDNEKSPKSSASGKKQAKKATNLSPDDLRPEAVLQRSLQQLADESQLAEGHPLPRAYAAATGTPAQFLMAFETFRQGTDFNKTRWSIKAIDKALKHYHKPEVVNKKPALEALVTAIDAYLTVKDRDDPQNERIGPVRDLLDSVHSELYVIENAAGNAPDVSYSADVLRQHSEDSDGALREAAQNARYPQLQADITQILKRSSRADRFVQLVRFYNNYAAALQISGIRDYVFKGLHQLGELDQALTDGVTRRAAVKALRVFSPGARLSGWQRIMLDSMAASTTDLTELKYIVSARFGILSSSIDALPQGEHTAGGGVVAQQNVKDWNLPGLKRAYTVMKSLPDGHAISNEHFQDLRRYVGGGGWYREEEAKIAIGYDDNALTMTIPNQPGYGVFINQVAFDQTVKHEVGHAVDKKLGDRGSAGYCATAAGGSWENYFQDREMMAEAVFTRTASHFRTFLNGLDPRDAANKQSILTDIVRSMFRGGGNRTDLKGILNIWVRNTPAWTGLDPGQKDAEVLRLTGDPAFNLTNTDLEAPWKSANGGVDFNGRVYVQYGSLSFASFASAARGRQVSNYQFRAPAEWFAEAYAAYYSPNAHDDGHGEGLYAADPTTFNYFRDTVDKAL